MVAKFMLKNVLGPMPGCDDYGSVPPMDGFGPTYVCLCVYIPATLLPAIMVYVSSVLAVGVKCVQPCPLQRCRTAGLLASKYCFVPHVSLVVLLR